MNWRSLLTVIELHSPASNAELDALSCSIAARVTDAEEKVVKEVLGDSPFPFDYPPHPTGRQRHITEAILPSGVLPDDYRDLMTMSNGGIFSFRGGYLRLFSHNDIRELMMNYHFPYFAPGVVPFADDAAGAWYGFQSNGQNTDYFFAPYNMIRNRLVLAHSLADLFCLPENHASLFWRSFDELQAKENTDD